MAAAWSQLLRRTTDYNCYELSHGFTPSCSLASFALFLDSFKASLKIYASVYFATALIRGKFRSTSHLRQMLLGIVRSSVFLAWSATGCWFFGCLLRKIVDGQNVLTVGLIPGLLTSASSIFLERKERRRLLLVYMLNICSEALYNQLVHRNYLRYVPHGDVLMFSIAMSGFLYLYKKREGMKDVTSSVLSVLVGPAEGGKQVPEKPPKDDDGKTRRRRSISRTLLQTLHHLNARLMQAGTKHGSCKHSGNCVYYCLKGFVRPFLIGYGIRFTMGALSSLPTILLKPRRLVAQLTRSKNIRTGLFLGSFCAIFKVVNCALRWTRGEDQPWHGLLGGFLAGFTLLIHPDPALAIYAFWKLVEVMYVRGADAGHLPVYSGGVEFLYTIVTALVYHCVVLEPHCLRRSYFKFIETLSANKILLINRKLLDVFGMKSSLMFPNQVMHYDHRYTSDSLKRYLGMIVS